MIAAALLFSALAAQAAAPSWTDCIHVSSTSARYKSSLDSVRDCQNKARQRRIDQARRKGKPLTYQQIERIEDRQRAETRDFLAHGGVIIEGANKSDRPLKDK